MLVKLSFPKGQMQPVDLSQFTGNQEWEIDGCRFVYGKHVRRADAWFVIEDCDDGDIFCEVAVGMTFFASSETGWPADIYTQRGHLEFLQQFDFVYANQAVMLKNSAPKPPFLPWMVNGNQGGVLVPHERDLGFLQALDSVEKLKPLSVFCSTQSWNAEHRLRLRFVESLKDYFGEDLDWFGNGIHPVDTKWEGLAKYERTIVLENRNTTDVVSEKLIDAFLSLSEPIYWGAPNASAYFPVNPENIIDIRDFEGSARKIAGLMRKPITSNAHADLIRGKNMALNDMHFLRRFARIAKSHQSTAGQNHEKVLVSRARLTSPSSPRGKAYARVHSLLRRGAHRFRG